MNSYCRAELETKDPTDHQETQGLKDQPETKDKSVTRDPQDPQEITVFQETQDNREQQDHLDHQEIYPAC